MSQKNEDLKALDLAMVGIIGDLCSGAIQNASSAVQSILEISANYIDSDAKSALIEFRSLYIGNEDVGRESERVNDGVDNLIEELQTKMEMGEDLSSISSSEDSGLDELARNRMALAALQKRLEKIISLDDAIKVKLLPILTSMQFEDLIHQRLDHIVQMWTMAVQSFSEGSNQDHTEIAHQIAKILISKDERAIYYPKMLNEEPPQTLDDQKSISDILF